MDETWTQDDAQRWHDVCSKQPEDLSPDELAAMKTLAEHAFRLVFDKLKDEDIITRIQPEE